MIQVLDYLCHIVKIKMRGVWSKCFYIRYVVDTVMLIPGQKYRFEEVALSLWAQTGLCSYKLLHVARQALRREETKLNEFGATPEKKNNHFNRFKDAFTCTSNGSSACASSVSRSSMVIVTWPLFWINITWWHEKYRKCVCQPKIDPSGIKPGFLFKQKRLKVLKLQ